MENSKEKVNNYNAFINTMLDGDIEQLKILIGELDIDVNMTFITKVVNWFGSGAALPVTTQTLLSLACINNLYDVANYLISIGADVNATLIQNIDRDVPIISMVTDIEIIQLLLKNGADINQIDDHGDTPIIHSIKNEALNVTKYLIDNGASLDCKNYQDTTPLMFAALYSPLVIVKQIIDKIDPKNIDSIDCSGQNALIYSVLNPDPTVFEFLYKESGICKDIITGKNNGHVKQLSKQMDIDFDLPQYNYEYVEYAQHYLFTASKFQIIPVIQTCIDNGDDIDIKSPLTGNNLIHETMITSDTTDYKFICYLIEKGVDVCHVNNAGKMPIDKYKQKIWKRKDVRSCIELYQPHNYEMYDSVVNGSKLKPSSKAKPKAKN